MHVTPEELGVAPAPIEELRGGDAQRNAELLLAVLRGEKGGRRSAVLLNSAAAIAVSGVCETLREGVRLAEQAIDSGAAAARVEWFVQATRERKAAGAPS